MESYLMKSKPENQNIYIQSFTTIISHSQTNVQINPLDTLDFKLFPFRKDDFKMVVMSFLSVSNNDYLLVNFV